MVHLLYSGLNNENETQSASYRNTALHFYAPRLVALRGEARTKETPQHRTVMLMPRAFARARSPRSFWGAGELHVAHTKPALPTGLMAPARHLLHVSRGVIIDLREGLRAPALLLGARSMLPGE